MGRHAKPSTHSSTGPMVAVAIATSGAFATVPLTQGVAQAAVVHSDIHVTAPSDDGWDSVSDAISTCESGNNLRARNPHSSASGKWQLLKSTWDTVGGALFAPTAAQATAQQQADAARRLYVRDGLSPWAASKHCWGGKVKSGGGHGKTKSHSQDDRGGQAQAPSHKKHHGKHAQSKPDTAPTPDVTPAPDSAPTNATYVVRGGDSLSSIALAHHHTWQELFAANKAMIANPNLIRPGITINLSDPPDAGTPERPDTKKPDDTKAAAPLAGEKVTGMAAIGAQKSIQVETTGYSFGDNQGGSNAKISAPVIHQTAAGDGTYQNPVTLAVPGHAGSGMQTPKGTRVYFPKYKFYGIVEDSGATPKKLTRFDIWTDGRGNSSAKSCMDDLTGTSTAILNPPPGEPVTYTGPRSDAKGCHAS